MAQGMVCAAQPEAVEAGIDVLAAGGNAVDAAVATALVQTAVDPQMCGIAGFGSMHVYLPQGSRPGESGNLTDPAIHRFIDFHGRAPLAARPDMWADLLEGESDDGFGFTLRGRVNEMGYGAITTPMTLKALDEALQRWGTRSLADLLPAAIDYCERGFMVRPHVSAYWNAVPTEGRAPHAELLTHLPETRRLYTRPDGQLRSVGELFVNSDMGRTYRRIAQAGVRDLYEGAIANEIAADMRANGGLLTLRDLAECATEDNEPIWGTYRGYRIASNRPPGGGLMLLEMLNILEHFDLRAMGHNSPRYIATVAEAMKIATLDKDTKVGDPRFVDVPLDTLISKSYAAPLADRIASGIKTHVPRLGQRESADTTHVTVMDKNGNCVSMTHSLGAPSGVVSPGLGFMYNGCMGVFDPRPGRPGSIAPGKSRFSSLAPTILFKDNKPVFVLGAPGGTYIAMGLVQTILNFVDFDMDAQQAVSAPRFSATSDTIGITNRILRRTERELIAMGYPVKRWPMNFHFAGVHAIRNIDGQLDGGADPGRDGMAVAV